MLAPKLARLAKILGAETNRTLVSLVKDDRDCTCATEKALKLLLKVSFSEYSYTRHWTVTEGSPTVTVDWL